MATLLESVSRSFDKSFGDKLLESNKYAPLTESEKSTLSKLFENTYKDAVNQVNEGTLTADVAQFTPIVLPMVRRIFPQLIANHLLGVQPMSAPTGYMYALVNQYLGTGLSKVDDRTDPDGAIYQFSDDDADKIAAAITDGTLVVGTTTIGSNGGKVLYVEEDKVLASLGTGNPLTKDTTVDLGSATGVKITAVYTNESSFYQVLKNYTGPYKTGFGETMADDMTEIGFSISRKSVEAQTRNLKGKYTVEMYQDLKAQHGLSADNELMNLMQYEIMAELDRQVVDFVKTNSTWLPDSPVAYDTASGSRVDTNFGRWEIERYRAQAIRIAAESQRIGLETKRGQGNTLLVSPMVATMLEQLEGFIISPVKTDVNVPVSGGLAGKFMNRFNVVVDQYAKDDYCTVLYKGANSRDAMGMYMPYVPLTFTRVQDYKSGQPVIIARSRYALDTIPGLVNANSNDRAKTYARSFGINFAGTVLEHHEPL